MPNDISSESEAQLLGREVLGQDDSVLAIIITDMRGKTLAYLSRSPSKGILDEGEIDRIGLVEFLGLKMTPRPGQDSGNAEYVASVYEHFEILVTELRNPRCVVGLKLTRSSNLEYVLHRVLQKYR